MANSKRTPGAMRPPQRVAQLLKDRIVSGTYQPGEWLPAERDLTGELKVHRRVIRAALELLDAEGYVYRRTNCRPVIQLPNAITNTEVDAKIESGLPSSKLIALAMWRGGSAFEPHGTAQQPIFWGMSQVLGEAGYHVVFLDLGVYGTEEENAEREAGHLRYVLEGNFGGIVFYSNAYQSNRELIQEVSRQMPLVLIDRMLADVQADYVGVQNRQATIDATEHLIGLGHRRIAFATLTQTINTVHDRLHGYIDALMRAFGDDRQEIILTVPDFSVNSWPVFDTVFSLPPQRRPSAVVCVNDHVAVRVIDRLDGLKPHLSVPNDVSILGFDNIVPKLPNGVGLATIEQPFEEIGRAAGQVMLRRIRQRDALVVHVELPCRLIMRDSVRAVIETSAI